MKKKWCLVADCADSLDLFEAQFVRKANGELQVRGGNMPAYKPEQTWVIPTADLDKIKGIVREAEEDRRKIIESNDIQYAFKRDDVTKVITQRLYTLLGRIGRKVSEVDFR